MKKNRIVCLALLLALLLTSFATVGCNLPWQKEEPDPYFITFDRTGYHIEGNTMFVEYGDLFTVPNAYLTDESGDRLDVKILWSLKDTDGNEHKNYTRMYYFDAGETYTLTFTADTDKAEIPVLTYTVVCRDTQAPEITLIGLRSVYSVGDICSFALQNIADASGVDDSKTSVRAFNVDSGVEQTLTGSSFALTAVGNYRIDIYVEDRAGNSRTYSYPIRAVEGYVEPQAENTLWGFESTAADACVSPAVDSDAFTYGISTEKTDRGQYSLKLDLKAGAFVNFYLTGGSGLSLSEVGDVVFHVWATNLVDEFRIYSRVDERCVNMDYKLLKNEWLDLSFDAHEMFDSEFYEINELRLTFWAEEDATLYIDGIYTTDFTPPWKDTDLKGSMWTAAGTQKTGLLADFDEPEYKEMIGALSSVDYSTPGGIWEILPAGSSEVPAGAEGGVLRFTTTSVPRLANTADQYSRDGFHIAFPYGIDIARLPYFTFNFNFMGHRYTRITVLLETDMGDTPYLWLPVTYQEEGGFQKFIISPAKMASYVEKSASVVTGMHIRFLRSESDYLDDPGDWTLYLDSMEYYYADPVETLYQNGDYAFSGYDHLSLVKVSGGAILDGIVTDEDATDGYAVKATTAFENYSGMTVLFDDIDVSLYEAINLRFRTAWPANPAQNAVSLFINGTSRKYGSFGAYTTVDLKSLMEEGETVLSTLSIFRNSCTGIEIYVDSVELVPVRTNNQRYAFGEGAPLPAVTWKQSAVTATLASDAAATDGYAMKLHFPSANCNATLTLFEKIDLGAYESVVIRFKRTANIGMYIQTSTDTDHRSLSESAPIDEYCEVDLIAFLNENGGSIGDLSEITFWAGAGVEGDLYIDSIVFLAK